MIICQNDSNRHMPPAQHGYLLRKQQNSSRKLRVMTPVDYHWGVAFSNGENPEKRGGKLRRPLCQSRRRAHFILLLAAVTAGPLHSQIWSEVACTRSPSPSLQEPRPSAESRPGSWDALAISRLFAQCCSASGRSIFQRGSSFPAACCVEVDLEV